MMTATNIQYEMAGRVQGLSAAGAYRAPCCSWAHRIGLIRDIDANLHLLKVHLPYHESDHVLNIAFNILAGGRTDRTPRTASQRRGLSQCPGSRPNPRSHHCRRLSLPSVR